jgi:hypothetical protein
VNGAKLQQDLQRSWCRCRDELSELAVKQELSL